MGKIKNIKLTDITDIMLVLTSQGKHYQVILNRNESDYLKLLLFEKYPKIMVEKL